MSEPTGTRILIADDDFFMRGQAKLALQDLGEVIEAECGETALALYKEYKPTITLLDIHMPKRSGKEVLRDILKFDRNAYVIMFSADAIPENISQAKFAGAKGFIVKPFTKAGLLKYVLTCPALQVQQPPPSRSGVCYGQKST